MCAVGAIALAVLSPASAAGKLSPSQAMGADSAVDAVAVQADGRIVVAGYSSRGRLTLARYRPSGALDPSFGRSGVFATGLRYDPAALAIRADGAIFVLASGSVACSEIGAACEEGVPLLGFRADGRRNRGFGVRGIVALPGATTGGDLAPQPDGKLVVVGSNRFCHTACFGQAILARFEASGVLDPSFGAGGVATLSRNGSALDAITVAADGSLFAAGDVRGTGPPYGSFVAHLGPNGAIDPAFGAEGFAFSPGPAYAPVHFAEVLLDQAGSILAGGGSAEKLGASRFLANGTPDVGFGSGGTAEIAIGGGWGGMVQAGGGTVVAAPTALRCRRALRRSGQCLAGFVLTRFTATGQLDPAFGGDGIVVTALGRGRSNRDFPPSATPVALPDGRVLVAGGARFVFGHGRNLASRSSFALAVYRPDGTLDRSFGSSGVVTTPVFRPRQSQGLAGRPR